MTRPNRIHSAPIALAGAAAIVAFASLASAPAAAEDYDMDCKVILCMPAGFPSGCSDAFDHMIDRLRDGKSPIGTCSMSDGAPYESYEIDYDVKRASSRDGWQCPAGKTLYHRARTDGDSAHRQTVNTFCYDNSYTQQGWSSDGTDTRTIYTNKTPPERTDVWVNLTVEPETDLAFSPGWQKFDSDVYRDAMTTIRYSE